jgi:hypothetical protein
LVNAFDDSSTSDPFSNHATHSMMIGLASNDSAAGQFCHERGVWSLPARETSLKNTVAVKPNLIFQENKEEKCAPTKDQSWIPKSLSNQEMAMSPDSKSNDFIKYRLNNPRITKRGEKAVPEQMWNAYFEQRRNVLNQLLKSYVDDDVVIHQLLKKSGIWKKRNKTVGSKYRGVSKNKNRWQVMIMGNFKKFYIGGIKTELESAMLYDKLAIFYHGIEAKTNFQYTKRQIDALISEPIGS